MKKLILSLFVILSGIYGFSQVQHATTIVYCNDTMQVNPINWVTYIDNQDFKIEYRFIDCDPSVGFDHEAVVLKIENKTTNAIDFDWYINIHRENMCKTCDYPIEYARTIRLSPNEIIEGSCDRDTNKQLKIFSRYIDSSYSKGLPLTGFQLHTLTATIVE